MEIGFIILRHVNSEITDNYWREAYSCVRKFYPDNPIMIIDDNSNYDFVSNIPLENTTVIKSEYKGRGELLPYIYYLKHRLFEKAVIIHDSVFFQQHVNFEKDNMPLWHFNNADCSSCFIQNRPKELRLISLLDLSYIEQLLELYNSKSFNGCFGGMSVITFEFLEKLNNKYHLENLLDFVTCRDDRMCLERVLGVIFTYEKKENNSNFGSIFNYNEQYSYDRYLFDKGKNYMPMIPVIKVWTGR